MITDEWEERVLKEQQSKASRGMCMPCIRDTPARYKLIEKDSEQIPSYYLYCQSHWNFLMKHWPIKTTFKAELL